MGYAIAEAAAEAGHDVRLISGPVNLEAPKGVERIATLSSDDMYDAVHRHLDSADVVVMCAAVADYKPAAVAAHKIKKQNQPLSLTLIPTRDILASLGQNQRQFLLVGFAAETNELEKNARQKLEQKNCDIIVANDIGGMDTDENEVTILFRNGEMKPISRAPKKNIARELVKIFSNTREKCLTKKMS